ncbi:uncharacterized protein LOC129592538 [Paramacrobiotus metropolitanus]|uniref:uncharacterized protein LOC129592538 n=1 Tax=Paramacrobiotus metropolitanus TaxID=2943436 RepID=UPI0024464F67|nr:uncharacterized protein LOC129592538 [Paramacrobiotus metropolitanus]
MRNSIIFCVALILGAAGSLNALRCYVCTSAQSGCSADNMDSAYSQECPATDDSYNTVRFCIKTEIEGTNVTMRACDSGCNAMGTCLRGETCQDQEETAIHLKQKSCWCTGNLCNNSPSLRTGTPVILAVMVPVATVILQSLTRFI